MANLQNELKVKLAKQLRTLRKKKGIGVKEMAKAAKVTERQYSKYENSTTPTLPKLDTAFLIKDKLDLATVESLTSDTPKLVIEGDARHLAFMQALHNRLITSEEFSNYVQRVLRFTDERLELLGLIRDLDYEELYIKGDKGHLDPL